DAAPLKSMLVLTWMTSLPPPPSNLLPATIGPLPLKMSVSAWLLPTIVVTPPAFSMRLIASLPLVQLAKLQPDRLIACLGLLVLMLMLWPPAAPVISAVDDSWAPICEAVKLADEVPDVLTNFRPSMLVSVAGTKDTLVGLAVDPTWSVSLPDPPLNESPAFAVPAPNTKVSSWLVPTYVSMPDVAKMLTVSAPLVQFVNCRPDRLSEPPADWENCRVSAWPLPVTVAVDDTRPDPS